MSDVTSVKLEKMRFGLYQELSKEFLIDSVDVSLEQRLAYDSITTRVRAHVWGENVETHTVEYPRDWWQALKERWFPEWLKARYPVLYTKVVIDVKAIYPTFRPSLKYFPVKYISQAREQDSQVCA